MKTPFLPFRVKKLRSHLAYSAFLLGLGCVCVGCPSLTVESGKRGLPQVNPAISEPIKTVGHQFGPWGDIAAGGTVLILQGITYLLGRHHTNKRVRQVQHAA